MENTGYRTGIIIALVSGKKIKFVLEAACQDKGNGFHHYYNETLKLDTDISTLKTQHCG